MNIIHIEATTIPDSWFQCIYSILDNGNKYTVERGSYVGETRLEFDFITVHIKHPYDEPYNRMLPEIPAYMNIPNPVEVGYIEQYVPYLMTATKKEGEEYSYGERLTGYCYQYQDGLDDWMSVDQVEHWIQVLKRTPNTNQAVLQVAQPQDCLLDEPPCLRGVHAKVKNNKLIFYPYFRSNDLWSGYPANLAGIAVLQKYMADSIGVEVGSMVYCSSGLHIYGYVEELAKIRANKM